MRAGYSSDWKDQLKIFPENPKWKPVARREEDSLRAPLLPSLRLPRRLRVTQRTLHPLLTQRLTSQLSQKPLSSRGPLLQRYSPETPTSTETPELRILRSLLSVKIRAPQAPLVKMRMSWKLMSLSSSC